VLHKSSCPPPLPPLIVAPTANTRRICRCLTSLHCQSPLLWKSRPNTMTWWVDPYSPPIRTDQAPHERRACVCVSVRTSIRVSQGGRACASRGNLQPSPFQYNLSRILSFEAACTKQLLPGLVPTTYLCSRCHNQSWALSCPCFTCQTARSRQFSNSVKITTFQDVLLSE
jgi:hypothetical protein